MKRILTVCVLILISITSLAQNGINYKAVVKDDSGNIIVNSVIDVSIGILEFGNPTFIYSETHDPTSDDNGIIIVNIGEGSVVSGIFEDIDWGAKDHFLNLDINIGDGWIDMGTTQFKVVPYALYAGNAATKLDNLSDGKSDSDGTNNGSSIFLGFNAGALDDESDNKNVGLGYYALNKTNTGTNNVAIGYQPLLNNVSGHSNTALGFQTLFLNTSGIWNTATGSQALFNNSTGQFNTASGILAQQQNTTGGYNAVFGAQALRDNTTGSNNVAVGYSTGSNVIGSNNTFIGPNAGAGGTLRNISGSVFIGSQAGYNETSSNRLYIDNSTTSEPLIFGDFAANFVRINGGLNINASSVPLDLVSSNSSSYISYSNSNGYKGYSGIYNGVNDMDFGTGSGNSSGKVHLVTSASPKLTVASNGNVGIGTTNPTRKLSVDGTGLFTGTLNVDGDLWAGSYGNFSSAYINNKSRLSSSTNFVPAAEFSYSLGLADRRWLVVFSHTGTISTSDRRDKTNITNLNYGLEQVMKLEPVSFKWKDMPYQGNKLGLIAQDLINVIPEVVHTHDWVEESEGSTQKKRVESERMGVYYSDLIPVLIKAIQEQQTQIEELKKTIGIQKQED